MEKADRLSRTFSFLKYDLWYHYKSFEATTNISQEVNYHNSNLRNHPTNLHSMACFMQKNWVDLFTLILLTPVELPLQFTNTHISLTFTHYIFPDIK